MVELHSTGGLPSEREDIDALRSELRALKDTIADGLIVIDENRKVTSFNPAAERVFGYTAAEVIGRHVKLLIPAADRAAYEAWTRNPRPSANAEIIGGVQEAMGCRKDGTTFPMSLALGEIRARNQRQLVGVVRDLTEASNNRDMIEGIASNLPGPVFRRIQRPDGTIHFDYVSDGLRRVFKLDHVQVMADPAYLVNTIHPADLEGWRKAIDDALKTMSPHDHQMRITGEDGETRWMRAIARPHPGENGEVVWDGLALDISAQKRVEAEHEESVQLFQNLLEAAPDAIWINTDDGVVYANAEAARMFGVDEAADLIGRDSMSLICSGDRAEVDFRRARLEAGERLGPTEIRRLRQDGVSIDTDTSAIGVNWHGQPANLIIARDITERKEREKELRQSQKMEALGQLTGGVAHDFNNLLAVLLMDMEQLAEVQADEEADMLVQEAQDIAHSAADLTARLLAFSRQQDLKPERTDLRKLIAECVSLLRRTIGEQIELNTVTAGDLWPVTIDPRQLEHALLNLTVNARDAMPSGGAISIEARNVSLGPNEVKRMDGLAVGDYVHISVTETGTGIPEDIVEKVFDPFFTTKKARSGTGLGLSMVYGFARQSGGHAMIETEEGNGARGPPLSPKGNGKRSFGARYRDRTRNGNTGQRDDPVGRGFRAVAKARR